MKKNARIIVVIIFAIAATALLIYWQTNKKAIIENKIENTVDKKSKSLYTLQYDSSFIDELTGNASFYNVSLNADTSLSATEENNVFNVRIAEVAIRGANVVGLLTGNRLQANTIHFQDPVIEIKKSKQATTYTKKDSLALYERLLGNYKMIQADQITVANGKVILSEKHSNKVTSVNDIGIRLTDFKIDSTKDYESLVSYFIKGMNAEVGSVEGSTGSASPFKIEGIKFSAPERSLTVKDFRQFKGKMVTNLVNISLSGLQTNTFLREQRIVADELKTDGGLLTIYRKQGGNRNTFETDSTFFDEARIRNLTVGKTKLVVVNKDKPGDDPHVLDNLRLTATDIPEIEGSLSNLVTKSKWIISGDGMKSQTKNKLYNISVGSFVLDKTRTTATFQFFNIKPTISQEEFVRTRKVQEDYFDLQSRNITLKGINFDEAFAGPRLVASEISLQPVIKIFNDRTLPRNTVSKVPMDPPSLIKNLDIPIDVDKLIISNGYISYRERGMISKKIGMLFFDNINAVLSNVTNISSVYKDRPNMTFNSNSRFLGKSKFVTTWTFPLNKNNGSFSLTGKLDGIDGKTLNVPLEPLAMISVTKGNVNSYAFETTGDQTHARTKSTLLYSGLKLNLLEKETGGALDKKNIMSFLANIFIQNKNPDDGKVRQYSAELQRDTTRSFFYLVSQSFFLGMRKTITGKDNVK